MGLWERLGLPPQSSQHQKKEAGTTRFRFFIPPGEVHGGPKPFPNGRVFYFLENIVDKERKEALQVTKELVAKFIETRTVSPNNFAEVFPVIYTVVYATISSTAKDTE